MFHPSNEEISLFLKHDASEKHAKFELYAKTNRYTYFIIFGTWVNLAHDLFDDSVGGAIASLCHSEGLLGAVSYCQDIASALIDTISGKDRDRWYLVQSFIAQCHLEYDGDSNKLLQLLRFPKRLTISGVPEMERNSVQLFLDANASCLGYVLPSYKLLSDLRSEVSAILKHFHHSEWDFSKCSFSSGSTIVGREMSKKVSSVWPRIASIDPIPGYTGEVDYGFGRAYDQFHSHYHALPFLNQRKSGFRPCREYTAVDYVAAVPKSYKTYRIVSPQDPIKNFLSGQVWDELDACLGHNPQLGYTDQSDSRYGAFLGSVTGRAATIDLSQASDRIPVSLIWETFPDEFCDLISDITCREFALFGYTLTPSSQDGKKVYQLDGPNREVRKAQKRNSAGGRLPILRYGMYASMGSRTTYLVESVFFLAVCRLSESYYRCYTKDYGDLIPPLVVGDDIVIDSKVAPWTMSLLEVFNAKVNPEKSYASGYYREACGAEYYGGYSTRTQYCPREVLDPNDVDSIASLIGMEHRLFNYPNVKNFLILEIRKRCPSMTSSLYDSPHADIWDYFPTCGIRDTITFAVRDADGRIDWRHKERRSALDVVRTSKPVETYCSDPDRNQNVGGFAHYCDELRDAWRLHTSLVKDDKPGKEVSKITYSQTFVEYTYFMYLAEGPAYLSPLDELLRISSPRLSFEEYMNFLGRSKEHLENR